MQVCSRSWHKLGSRQHWLPTASKGLPFRTIDFSNTTILDLKTDKYWKQTIAIKILSMVPERNNKTASEIGDDVSGKPPRNVAKRINLKSYGERSPWN